MVVHNGGTTVLQDRLPRQVKTGRQYGITEAGKRFLAGDSRSFQGVLRVLEIKASGAVVLFVSCRAGGAACLVKASGRRG